MDAFIYIMLGVACFTGIFLLGWQFGCWLMQVNSDEKEDLKWDYYGEKDAYDQYHNSYYNHPFKFEKDLYTKPVKPKAKKKTKKKKS